MPRANGIHIFDQINFLTNFILAGCGPKRDLIIELQTEAAKDLLLLLLGLDMQDVVQGFFDPRRGRNTKPGRHGRKRPGRFKFPDISDEIGKRVSVPEIGENFRKLPGGRYVLPGINAVEFVSIFAIVTEGVSDIVFDNVMGILRLNPEYCREFPRFQRNAVGGQAIIVPGGGGEPLYFDDPQTSVGFADRRVLAVTYESNWAVSVSVVILATGTPGAVLNVALRLNSPIRGQVASTDLRTIPEGETSEFTIDASAMAGEMLEWSLNVQGGTGLVLSGTVVGYGQSDWLVWDV